MSCFGKRETEFLKKVVLLDESEFPVTIQKSTRGQEVLEKVFGHIKKIEKDYFGLRYIDKSKNQRWLDPMKLVMNQLKSGPPYLLYFCVKFYASDPCCLSEEITRYLFFQQLKRDIFQGRKKCSQNILAEISAYALQSELGKKSSRQHTPGYVSEFRFIKKQKEDLEAKISESHKKLNGIVPSVAEYMYLDRVKWMEMYGVDLHLVKGEEKKEYFVALKPSGVVVYNKKTPVGTYLWPKITKIDFKGKKFYLNVKGKESREYIYVFYLARKSACKHLWKCCVEHHAFFRLDKVKPPPQSNLSGFLRTGSGFRYSGRTQKEAMEQGNKIKKKSPWVQRKPSKRYERRDSQASERGNKSSQKNIQVKNGVIPNWPVSTPDGNSYVTSPGYSMNDSRKKAMPWEELAQTQAGLYTPAPGSPRSTRSEKNTGKSRKRSRSPKFPKPHRRSGQSSGSETDKKRRRSRSKLAYYSDDDVGRRRRHHKRLLFRHHRGDGQQSYDGRSDGSSRPRQSRGFSDYDQHDSNSEKKNPALDIIQPRVAMTREAKELRHRHHRHHRHSHHGNPPSESGHSAFSAPIPTKVLHSMAPEYGLYGQQRQQISTGSIKHHSTYDNNAKKKLYGSPQRYNTSSVEAKKKPNDWCVLYYTGTFSLKKILYSK
ncbi:band 4.1-like protein 5 [Exaiptasia diaphana]|uniref:FERM domain-containing protein n=1 Tax=Exaiptasia diaphana TaxID=2652724 RepID=A0A913YUV4_EXADI|nr:band 4.1-like protein 5 [Exaiptasia diaphana]